MLTDGKSNSTKEKIEKAVKEFNKFREPEAVAKLLSSNETSFKIEFTGPFCRACGFYDYFDDFKIFLEEIGSKSDISQIEETREGAIVTFKIIN
jgi:hypothetical protein